MGNIVDESQIHALEFENNLLSVRLTKLLEDIFNEIGRLNFILEHGDVSFQTRTIMKSNTRLLSKFLRLDEDRA